jgi:hypothetical protein
MAPTATAADKSRPLIKAGPAAGRPQPDDRRTAVGIIYPAQQSFLAWHSRLRSPQEAGRSSSPCTRRSYAVSVSCLPRRLSPAMAAASPIDAMSSGDSTGSHPDGRGPGMPGALTGKKVSPSPSGRMMRRVSSWPSLLPVAVSIWSHCRPDSAARAHRPAGAQVGHPAGCPLSLVRIPDQGGGAGGPAATIWSSSCCSSPRSITGAAGAAVSVWPLRPAAARQAPPR